MHCSTSRWRLSTLFILPLRTVVQGGAEPGNLTVFSNVTDSLLWTGPEGTTIGITELTPMLEELGAHEVVTGFSQTGQSMLPLGAGEAAVAVTGWQYGEPFTRTIFTCGQSGRPLSAVKW